MAPMLSRTKLLTLGATLLIAACGNPATPSGAAAEDFADELRLRSALDLDPDPNVVEVELEARVADVEFISGSPTRAWTYDGGVPGPLIRAKVGDLSTIMSCCASVVTGAASRRPSRYHRYSSYLENAPR
jgi:FtsP/CotA-like multicopper oxidase with cupredoxin domain